MQLAAFNNNNNNTNNNNDNNFIDFGIKRPNL